MSAGVVFVAFLVLTAVAARMTHVASQWWSERHPVWLSQDEDDCGCGAQP